MGIITTILERFNLWWQNLWLYTVDDNGDENPMNIEVVVDDFPLFEDDVPAEIVEEPEEAVIQPDKMPALGRPIRIKRMPWAYNSFYLDEDLKAMGLWKSHTHFYNGQLRLKSIAMF